MSRFASLRGRLLVAGAIGIVIAALVASLLLGAAFERAALRAFDRRLDDDLDKLIASADAGPDGRARLRREPADERYDRIFSGWYWVAGLPGEVRVSRSAWDAGRLEHLLDAAPAQRRHFEAPGPRSQALRVAVQRVALAGAATPTAFAVAGDLAEARAEVADFRWFAGGAVALIALALLLTTALQVGFGLRPLRRIGATLDRMRADAEVRFDPASLPAEIAPLAIQVNQLLDVHAQRVERAGNAAADLAHALKTPLAALALESETESGGFSRRVATQVARMQAAVERHLAGRGEVDTRQRTPLGEVVRTLTALMLRVHRERAPELRVEGDLAARFGGRREDLEEMLGNLLDNACKWARSRVVVRVVEADLSLSVQVDDDGPGLSPEQIDRALQRGVRLDEHAPGSGLGLAIANDLAVAHGGVLSLGRSELGGLRVVLTFPAAD